MCVSEFWHSWDNDRYWHVSPSFIPLCFFSVFFYSIIQLYSSFLLSIVCILTVCWTVSRRWLHIQLIQIILLLMDNLQLLIFRCIIARSVVAERRILQDSCSLLIYWAPVGIYSTGLLWNSTQVWKWSSSPRFSNLPQVQFVCRSFVKILGQLSGMALHVVKETDLDTDSVGVLRYPWELLLKSV